ncbi:MAG: UbiD family decarboxylase [Candidatus Eisenbacteria bacterium]
MEDVVAGWHGQASRAGGCGPGTGLARGSPVSRRRAGRREGRPGAGREAGSRGTTGAGSACLAARVGRDISIFASSWSCWRGKASSSASKRRSARATRSPITNCVSHCHGPALWFGHVDDSPFSVVTNLLGSSRRIELALGRLRRSWAKEWRAR